MIADLKKLRELTEDERGAQRVAVFPLLNRPSPRRAGGVHVGIGISHDLVGRDEVVVRLDELRARRFGTLRLDQVKRPNNQPPHRQQRSGSALHVQPPAAPDARSNFLFTAVRVEV